MIICTHDILKIGEIINEPNSIVDKNLIKHKNVTFGVMREVTVKDYINYCKEENVLHLITNINDLIDANFYEISMD